MTDKIDKTRQLRFWRGKFGDDYVHRNEVTAERVRQRLKMWARILRSLAHASPASILEVGANIGLNLRALRALTGADLYALEPNRSARQRLIDDGVVPGGRAIDGTAAEIPMADAAVDMVFTSGVLIHVPPAELLPACKEMHRVARRYLLSIEYFSKSPEERPYHGQSGLLFKRDFGAYWLENFSDLEVVDYGFFWKPATGLDDLNWWLFHKAG